MAATKILHCPPDLARRDVTGAVFVELTNLSRILIKSVEIHNISCFNYPAPYDSWEKENYIA
jgi:hypothetical protein